MIIRQRFHLLSALLVINLRARISLFWSKVFHNAFIQLQNNSSKSSNSLGHNSHLWSVTLVKSFSALWRQVLTYTDQTFCRYRYNGLVSERIPYHHDTSQQSIEIDEGRRKGSQDRQETGAAGDMGDRRHGR